MMDIDNNSNPNSKQRGQSKTKTKNKNKGHKSTPTDQFKTQAENFKQPKSGSKLLSERREDRFNRSSQIRKNKINELILKKRGIIDSDESSAGLDSSSSILKNKSMSLSNLTQLIDTTAYKVPPKLCALVSLNEQADLDQLMSYFQSILIEDSTENNQASIHKVSENMFTGIVPHKLNKGKERISIIKTSRDFYSILDVCKVADIIIFTSSCKLTDYQKWKTDPDKYSNSIDEFGYKILQALRAQGLTQHICALQDLSAIPMKQRNDIKKLFHRYFESELKPDKIFDFKNSSEFLSEDKDEYRQMIRLLCKTFPNSVSLDLKKHRSYMLCEKINILQTNNNNTQLSDMNKTSLIDLELCGYLRGNTLNVSNYIHITGFGDYLVSSVEVCEDPCPINLYTPSTSEHKSSLNTSKGMQVEGQTLPSLHNKENKNLITDDKVENIHTQNLSSNNQPQLIGSLGEYIQNKQDKKTDKMLEEIIAFDIDIKDDGEELSFDEDDDLSYDDEEGKASNKHKQKTSLQYRSPEDMEFADEVDTPIEMTARERFSKYRGLASMKQGSWDQLENLPKEYSNIYAFENVRYLQKKAIKKAHEEGLKLSGNYVKILIKNFSQEDLNFMRGDVPLILSTLLDHERKLCVMHYKISINFECDDYLLPKPKQAMETQCGFRRILTRPIYSTEITSSSCDKLKIERKLLKDKFYIASVYSQMTYPNSPVLLFSRDQFSCTHQLAASGIVVESDAQKILLKRIILTGYPLKIKKKKAVVRYMFFTPNDVNYFKPVQLVTKHGLRGHITESLGTHGYMKCIFNDFVKASDTICMHLYKRVFPKWFKESWKYKICYGNRPDYKNYFSGDEEKLMLVGNKSKGEDVQEMKLD